MTDQVTITIATRGGAADADDWGRTLLQMYESFCVRKGMKVEKTLNQLTIWDSNAYELLKTEEGIHRRTRKVPKELDPQERRWTVFAEVRVSLNGETTSDYVREQVRFYVMDPYTKVMDLRTGYTTDQVEDVLSGNLEPLMKGRISNG